MLDSVAVFAGAADVLSVEPAEDFSLSLTGPFAEALSGEADNLVLRAGRALARWEGIAPAAQLTLENLSLRISRYTLIMILFIFGIFGTGCISLRTKNVLAIKPFLK